ncbi:hypothetical protein FJ960_14200 [Mesorhizobium sp. B2-3-11]|uniref:hypothetical protein n=1 Tax=Mesorhizobium sp. B2-3-11 TaxID=2589953 RepID=UPI00112A3396|nr:hypothetical protein [Mesorhizobium sp. B2-3-11]TPM03634.1 hypothetical protein FJ960_14200 [Mesorhizobium sp. B2-3-11]
MSEAPEAQKPTKPKSGRSPAYPVLTIDKAISQANALRKQEGDYAAPLTSAFAAWGYGAKSSGGRQTLATLKYYGLIDIAGENDARKVKVSDAARKILLDEREDQTEKKVRIREAALKPAAHQILFNEYPTGLASDGTVRHFLIFDHGFNTEAANELISQFRQTASFAGIYEPQKSAAEPATLVDKFAIGDYVNCEIDGQLQWGLPWRIVESQKHTDGEVYYRVQGTGSDEAREGWIPMSQAVAAEAPKDLPRVIPAGNFPPPPPAGTKPKVRTAQEGMREDKASLDEGEVILQWPETLSADSVRDFEYWVDGIIRRAKRRAGIE